MAAVRHLVILDHPRSRLSCSITLSKFGVDPNVIVRDIEILRFCQFDWKMPNHVPSLWFFWEFEPTNTAGRHQDP